MGTTPAVPTAEPPPTLGAYTLLTKLATGGMATVYLGIKYGVAGFERLVAIKACHPHLGEDEEFLTMFLDEARLAARIHHPNVVATLDVDCTDVVYLVMDYVEGDTLGSLLRKAAKQGGKLPVGVAVHVMTDALKGLHAAHELRGLDGQLLNLVHRDVSPQNILVGVDGASRITDFGIAFAAARSTVTEAGRLKGKFSYMSPEQVQGKKATRRIDVFGAGIVLWESLAGRALFRRKDDAATLHAVLTERIAAPSSFSKDVPPELDAVVLRALSRIPDERYQTAAEFAEALERLGIPDANSKSVANHVESAVGPMLAQRRNLVRERLEQGPQTLETDAPGSDVRSRFLKLMDENTPMGSVPNKSRADKQDTQVSGSVSIDRPDAGASTDIEHRRMRGLLAALMLLLVGGALGLLLARNAQQQSSTPTTTSASP
jgi:serine/threonine-protein kinase